MQQHQLVKRVTHPEPAGYDVVDMSPDVECDHATTVVASTLLPMEETKQNPAVSDSAPETVDAAFLPVHVVGGIDLEWQVVSVPGNGSLRCRVVIHRHAAERAPVKPSGVHWGPDPRGTPGNHLPSRPWHAVHQSGNEPMVGGA